MGCHFWMEELECVNFWIVRVRQQVGFVLLFYECSDVNCVSIRNEHRGLVIVCSTVVWRGEDSDHWRKLVWTVPLVEFVASLLAFMRSDYSLQAFLLEQFVNRSLSKDDGNCSLIVKHPVNVGLTIACGISPE